MNEKRMSTTRTNHSRRERIDLDVFLLQRPRQRPHQPDDAVLGRRVDGRDRERVQTRVGGGADDAAFALNGSSSSSSTC